MESGAERTRLTGTHRGLDVLRDSCTQSGTCAKDRAEWTLSGNYGYSPAEETGFELGSGGFLKDVETEQFGRRKQK